MDISKTSQALSEAVSRYSPQVSKPEQTQSQLLQKAQNSNESVSVNRSLSTSPSEVDSVKINSSSVTIKNLALVRDLEQMHVNMNRLAKGIRETNEALVKVAEQARQMQGETYAIIKNFPPFTHESLERKQILMSYISIEKEILKMTVPPPLTPIYERISHLWDASFDSNGQLLPSAVPSLQTDSSDQEIKAAALTLEQLGQNFDKISSASTEALIGR